MPPHRQLGCLSIAANLNKCDSIHDDIKKINEDDANSDNNDKRSKETVVKESSEFISYNFNT